MPILENRLTWSKSRAEVFGYCLRKYWWTYYGFWGGWSLDAPKESDAFWSRLAAVEPFDPTCTLFVDDNADVLDAAHRHGIAHLRTIAQPDSARPARAGLRHETIEFEDALP